MVQNGSRTVTIDPETVGTKQFAHAFRGYDTHEVQAFLAVIGDEMTRLRDAAEEAEQQARSTVTAEGASSQNSFVGDEAGRVLHAAEDAAAEIKARAEDAVAKLLRDAQAEAAAERSRAQQERADVVSAAEREAATLREAASAELEDARAEGRAMVEEARDIRDRVLGNLGEKRQVARRELAQLRAGIDELRQAYGTVEELLAATLGEVDRAVPSARAAAMRAGEQVSLEPERYVAPGAAHQYRDEDEAAVPVSVEPVDAVEEQAAVEEPVAEEAAVEEQVVEDAAVEEPEAVEEQAAVEEPVVEEPATEDVVAEDPALQADMVEGDEGDEGDGEVPVAVDESARGTVIDLRSRRASADETEDGTAEDRAAEDRAAETGDLDHGDIDDVDDELDPELPSDDAIEERRRAERRQLFEEHPLSRGERVLEFSPVMDAFGPAEEAVPLVPAREAADIDSLFARIRESRAGAVAQAREVLHRTGDIPPITADTLSEPAGEMSLDPLVRRDEALGQIAPPAVAALKRVLADQLNEVLDAMRRNTDGIVDVEQLLPAAGDRAYGEALREYLVHAAARGSNGGDTDIGPVVRAVSGEIGSSLRSRIAHHLQDADQLERRVRATYREWRRERVEQAAGDAVAAAYGLGLLSSLSEGTPVRWLIPDGGCCSAECLDNSLAGDVVAGEPFPTGDVMAPARPGCRALVVPRDQ